ncbi:MAG: hypothetical protein ACE5IY_19650 [bacterium]
MSTVLPEGEAVRKAVKWISEQVQSTPGALPRKFIHEAITRFDLSPKDANLLIRFYTSDE